MYVFGEVMGIVQWSKYNRDEFKCVDLDEATLLMVESNDLSVIVRDSP